MQIFLDFKSVSNRSKVIVLSLTEMVFYRVF